MGKIFVVRGLLTLIMFWNLENYFDPFESNGGGEYTPLGERHWTWKKFSAKNNSIAKTIIATSDRYGVFPCIIGVCEVENIFVLKQLTQNTILNALKYKILHKNSIDRRGIDVALLYKEKEVSVMSEVYFPDSTTLLTKDLRTRYVLYAKCFLKEQNDTLHLFVNHWPSKIGGSKSADSGRMFISEKVKQKCDSILRQEPLAKIVVMGDFNDTPESESVMNLCRKRDIYAESKNQTVGLINLTPIMLWRDRSLGSYKYKGKWEAIDQFLVSDSTGCKMEIFDHPSLLERDKKFLGTKIRRTHVGPNYQGGASDHLPIVLKIDYDR